MEQSKPRIASLLVGLASLVLIVAGMRAMSSLLSPILLSLFIVLVASPILRWLKVRGFPDWLAYMAVVMSIVVVGLFGTFFLATSLNQLSRELPTYTDQVERQIRSLAQWLQTMGVTSEDVQSLEWLQPEQLLQFSISLVSALLNVVSTTGFTLLVFIYMLASAPSFSKRLRQGLAHNQPMLARCDDFARSMSTYLLIKSWLGALTALIQIILMAAMGIDFAVLWGVLSFIANFIPSFGFYLALIPPLLLAIVKLGVLRAVIFAVIYALINNFFDIVIAPRFLSKGLDLSTIVGFVAVIIWTWIFGPIGAFIALPLTVMVKKLLLESYPETQLVAKLLSAGDD
ncbi:MAG: AI-2E family transporter [Cyanobacteria bacterium P01_F01_bin.42]